jgi:PAS domain S-box-containing protein
MSATLKLDNRPEVNTEIVAAEGLRASHDVISVLERCKSSSEQIIQNLPDLFVIMDRTGRILKGNKEASKLLNCDDERMLNKNIYDVFTIESKNIFKSRISVLLKDLGIKQLQFELTCIDENGHQAEYLWTISKFAQISERRGPLIKVLGKNISKVKEFEKKLSQIFSAIPLGIFTVNSAGEIEWPYSLYSEFLLGDNNSPASISKRSCLSPSGITLIRSNAPAPCRWSTASVGIPCGSTLPSCIFLVR